MEVFTKVCVCFLSFTALAHDCPNFPPVIVQVFCGNASNGYSCIDGLWVCDGLPDCETGFDESEATCSGGRFVCCVDRSDLQFMSNFYI